MRSLIHMAAAAGLLTGLATAQTVTVSLTSPADGGSVNVGDTVTWEISFTVSSGDNAGLALLATDLVQNAGNPELIDIPVADSVPAALANFARPGGIANPMTSFGAGYQGTPVGTPGAQNLVQIGGAQNNSGTALTGLGVGESAAVVGGVGQSGSVILATGSMTLNTEGTYTFSLSNTVANTLSAVNASPLVSPATAATVDASAGTITFDVSSTPSLPGDLNGDGVVDGVDLSTLLGNFGVVGGATPADGDIDGDGNVNGVDLSLLLGNFGSVAP